MWPVLFRIPIPDWFPEFLKPADGHFPIRMFGVMVILGFLAGTWVVQRRLARQKVMSKDEVFDFCFYLLAFGILGARLMYVLQNFGEFEGKLGKVFAIWEGGLVWYGGFALSTLFAFWWLWTRKYPVLKVTDAAAIGLALGLAVGRWGCYFAGDDYGKKVQEVQVAEDGSPVLDPDGKPVRVPVTDPAKAPWYAIQVPKGSNAPEDWRSRYCETPMSFRAPNWLHPVQIYMSLKNLVVLGVLLLVAQRARRTGMLTATYLMAYPVARFVVEFWRGDEDRLVDVLGTGMSFSQFFGIFVFLFGVMVLRMVQRRPADLVPGASTA